MIQFKKVKSGNRFLMASPERGPLRSTHLWVGRSVANHHTMTAYVAPILFVLIWSSGFVVARGAVPHAAPELFLLVRMILTTIVLAAATTIVRQRLPRGRRIALHLLTGALLNGVYLCTSWWAIGKGMPAGILALLGALQPLIVAIGAFLFLNERLPSRSWIGLGIGIAGVVLVLRPLLIQGAGISVPAIVVIASICSIVAMAAGTMIQRGPLAQDDLFAAGALQNVGGALVAGVAAFFQGNAEWDGTLPLWFALGWSVIILSAAGLSLFVWMTRHQGATRVSLLLLLVPPLAAVEARILFGERLTAVQLVGFLVALGGVLIARAKAGTEPDYEK